MVKDHQQEVAEFRKESKTAKDPEVKSFASQTLPTLEDHVLAGPPHRSQRFGTVPGSHRDAATMRPRSQSGSSRLWKPLNHFSREWVFFLQNVKPLSSPCRI
jgi:Domain of unknown function (DUF4142)